MRAKNATPCARVIPTKKIVLKSIHECAIVQPISKNMPKRAWLRCGCPAHHPAHDKTYHVCHVVCSFSLLFHFVDIQTTLLEEREYYVACTQKRSMLWKVVVWEYSSGTTMMFEPKPYVICRAHVMLCLFLLQLLLERNLPPSLERSHVRRV